MAFLAPRRLLLGTQGEGRGGAPGGRVESSPCVYNDRRRHLSTCCGQLPLTLFHRGGCESRPVRSRVSALESTARMTATRKKDRPGRKGWGFWTGVGMGVATSSARSRRACRDTQWGLHAGPRSRTHRCGQHENGQVGDLSPSQGGALAQVSVAGGGEEGHTGLSFS